ncbi:hypothetical protein BDF19DRAFT_448650 [Syncephalis fuscata]|nr:hypothetical protein BDF19DRAFT_448650 [Syncephalis fuscata]
MTNRRKQTQSLALHNSGIAATVVVATAAVAIGFYLYRRLWFGGGGDSNNNDPNVARNGRRSNNGNLSAGSGSGKSANAVRRAMTISLRNVILWNPSPDPSTPTLGFLQHAVSLLRYYAANYDLYLIMPVTTIEEKDEVMRMLSDAGLLAPAKNTDTSAKTNQQSSGACLDEHKVVFCETSEGVAHIVRHLTPAIHIDADLETIRLVRTFVGRLVWVRPRRQAAGSIDEEQIDMPHLWQGRGAPIETISHLAECSFGPSVQQSR